MAASSSTTTPPMNSLADGFPTTSTTTTNTYLPSNSNLNPNANPNVTQLGNTRMKEDEEQMEPRRVWKSAKHGGRVLIGMLVGIFVVAVIITIAVWYIAARSVVPYGGASTGPTTWGQTSANGKDMNVLENTGFLAQVTESGKVGVWNKTTGVLTSGTSPTVSLPVTSMQFDQNGILTAFNETTPLAVTSPPAGSAPYRLILDAGGDWYVRGAGAEVTEVTWNTPNPPS